MRTPLIAALVCLAGPALAGPPAPGLLKRMVGAGHPLEVKDALNTAGNLSGTHGDAVLKKVISGAPRALSSYSARALIRGMKNNDTRYNAASEYVSLNAADLSIGEVKQLAREIEPEISASLRANLNTVRQNQNYEASAHMGGYILGDTPGRRLARALEAQNQFDLKAADQTAAKRRDALLYLYAKGRPMSAKTLSGLAREAETPAGRTNLEMLAYRAQK
jgi:hypothetical protein